MEEEDGGEALLHEALSVVSSGKLSATSRQCEGEIRSKAGYALSKVSKSEETMKSIFEDANLSEEQHLLDLRIHTEKEGEIKVTKQNNDRISSLIKTRADRYTVHLDKMKAKNKVKDAFVLELKETSDKKVAEEKVLGERKVKRATMKVATVKDVGERRLHLSQKASTVAQTKLQVRMISFVSPFFNIVFQYSPLPPFNAG